MADAHAKPHHDYHLVNPSPWPFLGSVGALVTAIGGVCLMQYLKGGNFPVFGHNIANPWLFFIGMIIVLYTMFAWWSDTIKEAHEGYHTRVVSLHLRYGMIMFIASEVMFFVAWFWAFFDASLFPGEANQYARTAFTGGVWPPKGMEVLDPFHLPLYNTIILLLSGTTVTWAHHALLHGDRKGLVNGLVLTVGLGMLFTMVQAYEYM
ncbi:cytochrome c oxidase subunit 3, partial [Mesorhizobium sp. M2A.F.Ca.ET.039.01.1.1]